MDIIRRTLGGLFAILGTYYCVLSALTVARLPGVTARWIEQSGDPDFKYDYDMFMLWIAVGAALVGVFGFRTVVKGIAAIRGRRDSWLALAIGAPVLHWFWFLAIARRDAALRFGAICIGYVAAWLLMRDWSQRTRLRVRDAGPAGRNSADRFRIGDSA